MKVLLIFPPQWIPYGPYLSLPSLCAYLKSNGINVVQKDFNIEAYDLLLSERYLKGLKERLQNRFYALDSKDRLMPGEEQEYYSDLFKAKSSVIEIAEKIESAKRVFRTKQDFYDVNKLHNARNTLEQALVIISTAYSPTWLELSWFTMPQFKGSIAAIKELTQNRSENPFLELYENHLIPFIREQDPDIIGISIIGDSQLIPALTLSRLIKSSQKKAHVVIGGYVITLLADALTKHEELFHLFFDSAVLCEGERPLLKLVEHISHGQTLEDVPNLIYRDRDRIRTNEVIPPENINSLPTPCFDELPLNSYLSPEPVLPLLSSRGCYWGKCAFCAHNLTYGWHYQNRDAKKVADDMQELSREHGAVHFAFADEGMSPSTMNELSDEIIKRGMKVRCSTNIRIENRFTPELCNKAFKAGFRLLYLGLESGCNRVLNHMKKGISKETAAEVCRNIHNAGIWDHLYVFFGFPTESRAEAQETIDFLLSNKNIICSFNIGNFILSRGSAVMNCPEEYGISGIKTGPETDFVLTYGYTTSSGLTAKEAFELSSVYWKRIVGEYESKEVLKQLAQDDFLLYLSHYEKNEPFLRSIVKVKVNNKEILPNKQLTMKSIPKIKNNVVWDKLQFNLSDIIYNILNNRNLVAYPCATSVIFNPVSGKLRSVALQDVEVLVFCDGRNNVKQIVRKISKKHDIPRLTSEKYCIDLFKSLAEEGFVLLSNQVQER